MDKEISIFGSEFWSRIQKQPLGSLPKRELELNIIKAAISAKLIANTPYEIARKFSISLTKAHGYLDDLALREEEISDKDALLSFKNILSNSEILTESNYLVLPINDAQLRIWIERKISKYGLCYGEVMKKDIIKITPYTMLKFFKYAPDVLTPYEALNQLKDEYKDKTWFSTAKKTFNTKFKWEDVTRELITGVIGANSPFLISLISKAFFKF